MITVTCQQCGKSFQWERKTKSNRHWQPPKYCSHDCRHKAWRAKMEKQWAQKTPIHHEPKPKGKGPHYKTNQWIQRVHALIERAGGLEQFLIDKATLPLEEQRALIQISYKASARDHELIHRFLAQMAPVRR